MNKVTKKLLISVMILMVTASLAITSTYAWFTMNDTPEVAGFDLEVTTVDGLYISLSGDDGTFKSYLTSAEITTALMASFSYGEGEGAVLKSLTHGTSSNGESVAPISGVAGVRENETAYYSFRIYFRSNNKYAVSLKLATAEGEAETLKSSVTTKTESTLPKVLAWDTLSFSNYNTADTAEEAVHTKAYTLGQAIDARAADAVRISFNGKIWDPNKGVGFADDQTNNAAYQYYKHVSLTAPAFTAPAADTVDAEEVLVTLTETDGVYNGYVDVILWLEGWDGNALNSVLGDIFTTRLVFKGTLVD